MYRPPNVDIQCFQSCYNSLLCEMKKAQAKYIIIGLDHNLDFLKSSTHSGTSQFIQHNLDFNLIPTITRPTRITKSSATLIDNIMVSQSLCGSYTSSILIDDISDHMPSACILKCLKKTRRDPLTITSRDTRPKNMTALKSHLQSYDWHTILDKQDVNACMIKVHGIVETEMDLCIPEVTQTIKAKHERKEPWMTASLKRCVDKNKRLYCKMLKNKNNSSMKEQYLAYNRTLRKSLKLSKQRYHRDKCAEFHQNTKKLWQMINKISGRTNDKSSSIDCITIAGIKRYRGTEIADALASYFSTVGKRFAEKIPKPTKLVKTYLELLQ